MKLYDDARAKFAKEPAKAKEMATNPLGPVPKGADTPDAAAWTVGRQRAAESRRDVDEAREFGERPGLCPAVCETCEMHPRLELLQHTTRRHFLQTRTRSASEASALVGTRRWRSRRRASHSDLMNPLAPRKPHFAGKAKRVIYLHMSGAPPHLDLFDYKPELVKRDGEGLPGRVPEGQAVRVHHRRAEAARHAAAVRAARQGRRLDVGRDRRCTRSPTTCASSGR